MVRITTNMPALMDWRQSGETRNKGSLSMERLKKDLNIRADGDRGKPDISDKMCDQIRGHNQATCNVQEEISLLQSAAGGLNEIQSLLQKMRESLQTVQGETSGAGEPITSQGDVSELIGEIDRVAADTQFAGKHLLDGNAGSLGHMDSGALGISNINTHDPVTQSQAMQQVDSAMKQVVFAQERLAEAANGLEQKLQDLLTASENLSASESLIRESGTALESLNLASYQIRRDANLALLAQGNLQQLRTSYLLFNTE